MGFSSLPKVGVPSFPVVLLFGKMSDKKNEQKGWEHSWNLYRAGKGDEGRSTEVVKWTGKQGCLYQSFIPSGSGAPLHWVPTPEAKHRISSLFCGCGGTVSWRTPYPEAAKETRRRLWNCDFMYCEFHSVHSMWACVSPWGLFDVHALGWVVFLKHKKIVWWSTNTAHSHSQMAF